MRSLLLKALAPVVALTVLAAACGGQGQPAPSPTATTPGPAGAATPGPPGPELTTAQIVERLRPSVVHILTETATIDVFGQVVPQRGVGTGFIIDEEGRIVTNNHVITLDGDQPVQKVTVTLSDGRKFSARIVGRDRPTDLAVLDIDAQDLMSAKLGDSSRLQVGDEVVAIGKPWTFPAAPPSPRGWSAPWIASLRRELSPSPTPSRPTPPSTPATPAAPC